MEEAAKRVANLTYFSCMHDGGFDSLLRMEGDYEVCDDIRTDLSFALLEKLDFGES